MLFLIVLALFAAFTAVVCLRAPRASAAEYKAQKENYQRNHQTLGCRLTHMVGIPLIWLSIPALALGWQWTVALFVLGWIFQLAGHFIFEKNKPVLASDKGNRFTVVYAVIFVAEEWARLLSGRSLTDDEQ